MEKIILGLMLLEWVILMGVIQWGARGLKIRPEAKSSPRQTAWPLVALILPVTGSDPLLWESLSSFANQDYPACRLFFVVRDEKDPAFNVIQNLARAHGSPACILSGLTVCCGQKNHSLLAGVRAAEKDSQIFVFADSGHVAPPGWLKHMVRPILDGRASVTTGYHRIESHDRGMAVLGRALTVLVLHLLQGMEPFTQPWGGATAITRKAFQDLQIEELWARTLVDDVSLAARLKKTGMKVLPVPAAILSTPLPGETFSGWARWLTRQFFFLKLYFPMEWAAGGALLYVLAGLMLLTVIGIASVPLGLFSGAEGISSAIFLAALIGLAERTRRIQSIPASFLRWVAAGCAFIFMMGWSHFRSACMRTLHWRGIGYGVSRGGDVVQVVVASLPPAPPEDQ